MMTVEIEVEGRTRRAVVERIGEDGTQFRVTLDGTAHHVDAARLDAETWSLVFPAAGAASYRVGFAEHAERGELSVFVAGATMSVLSNGRRGRRGHAAADAAGEQRVVAPMPGKVLRLLAAPGDLVEARQPVVVVEAMKMENELSSPRAGRVRDVTVAAGDSVEAGRVLVVVE
jgi:biotin carboxyl carrier protein